MTSKTEATLEDMGKSSTLQPSKGKKRLMSGISHKIPKEELKPGDHIYTWRVGFSYAHHGIYVADEKVIHFTPGGGQEIGTGTVLDKSLFSSSPHSAGIPCTVCGKQSGSNGVISSCLDCFLSGGKLYRFRYNTSLFVFLATRGGTCTCATSDPPEDVIHRAEFLLKYGFGVYHVVTNNCEDFALYCKTGILVPDRGSGSGQVCAFGFAVQTLPFAMMGIFMTSFVLTTFPPAIAAIPLAQTSLGVCGFYTVGRYATDIGNRESAIKIPVDQLVSFLGLTEAKNAKED